MSVKFIDTSARTNIPFVSIGMKLFGTEARQHFEFIVSYSLSNELVELNRNL